MLRLVRYESTGDKFLATQTSTNSTMLYFRLTATNRQGFQNLNASLTLLNNVVLSQDGLPYCDCWQYSDTNERYLLTMCNEELSADEY